jgi:hypothetical protein
MGVADTNNAPPGLIDFAMMNSNDTAYLYGGYDSGKHISWMQDFVQNDVEVSSAR